MDRAEQPNVLPQGFTPVVWNSREDPRTDFLTRIAAAAFAADFDLPGPKFYQHHLIVDEELEEEPEEIDRRVSWIWDGSQKVKFTPIAAEEEITIQEFRRRFEDLDWIRANPTHPISYMRAFLEQSRKTMEKVIATKPCLRITRGDDTVIAPPGATDEEIEEQFDLLAEVVGS